MAWSEYRLNSWSEFDEQVFTPKLSLTALKHTYVYRGQSRAWSLLPSLARLCRDLSFDSLKSQEVEELLLQRFKARVDVYMPTQSRKVDTIGWWTLMQHYRAPTRILDWTYSPVVALYFAVADNWDSDGVLWSFHRLRVMNRRFPDGVSSVATELGCDDRDFFKKVHSDPKFCAFDRTELTERMIAQNATFTVSQDVLTDHADALELLCPETEGTERVIIRRKWIISKDSKPAILKRLHAMNVTAETLFPGIDGLGNGLREYVRLSIT
jgi:hypothetical protein